MATRLWLRFVLRRLVALLGVAVVLVCGVFVMVQAVPGDPVSNALGPYAEKETIARIAHENGFDKPLADQFWAYVVNLAHGDLGSSFLSHEKITHLIRHQASFSLELAGMALLIVLLVSVPLGLVAGAFTREGRHRKLEVVFTTTTTFIGVLPELLVATLLVTIVAVTLRWLPAGGAGHFDQLILPAIAVALPTTMTLARIVRIETLNVLAQDYIRTARSKWLPPWRILLRHVLPNVLTAALTIVGVLFSGLIAGAVVAETIFARPGLGTTLINAVVAKNYPVVQGIVLVLGIVVVTVTMLVDTVLAILDPRSLTRHV